MPLITIADRSDSLSRNFKHPTTSVPQFFCEDTSRRQTIPMFKQVLNKTVFENLHAHARVPVMFHLIAYDGAVDGGELAVN